MWIIPLNHPLRQSLSDQAFVASKEELVELPDLEKSLLWRSRLLLLKIWSQKWNKVFWLPLLFGRTLKHSQHISFEEKLISYLQDIHANPLVMQVNGGGAEDPRHIYPYIERTVDIIRPDICFFENVRGHITLGLKEVIGSLEGLGYRVHWGIFSAEETGASHKRERVFILAIRMDNTGGNRHEPEHEISTGRNSAEFASETKLANTNNDGKRARSGKIESQGPEIESQGPEIESQKQREGRNQEEREWMRPELSNESSGGELANPDNSRSGENIERSELRAEGIEQSPGNSGITTEGEVEKIKNRRVARPNSAQYDWESPRTTKGQWETKSGMGGRVNGYKFREDFLRALGNSVFEDTAEVAFRELLKKHGIEI